MKKNLNYYLFLFITAAVFVLNSCNSTEIPESKLPEKRTKKRLNLAQSAKVSDTDVNEPELQEVIDRSKKLYEKEIKAPFPQDPIKQLWGSIGAVFGSWMSDKAVTYRRVENIVGIRGTAVNYADPAYYREYTGDSIIMQLRFKKIDGILQPEMEAAPILITNYNEKDAPVIKRFTQEWVETLPEKERAYYLKRLELMRAYLPKLK